MRQKHEAFSMRTIAIRWGALPVLTVGLLSLATCVSSSLERRTQWRPATYRGIVLGKATIRDVLTALGQPTRIEQTIEGYTPAEDWYFYDGQGDFDGELGVFVNSESGVVQKIILFTDEEDVRQEEVTARYGPAFALQRYNSEPGNCDGELGNEDEAVMYEDQRGPMTFLEYRHRGIAVEIDEPGRVSRIFYVWSPIGNEAPRCRNAGGQP